MPEDTEASSENQTPFKINYLQGEHSGDSTSIKKSDSESLAGSILSDVGRYATLGKEFVTVSSAYLAGNTDENSLTNTIFFDRHPELNSDQRLKPHQKELIEEWLRLRNDLVRPTVANLKSKGKESSAYSGLPLGKPPEFAPGPMKLPPENPVEFAPEPIGTAYWPLVGKDKDWHVVSYRYGPSKNDFVRGRNTEREFYASRGDRYHHAIDLYGEMGDRVVSIQDGIFLYAIENFLGNTSAMYIEHTVEHPNVIIVYGEIKRKSWEAYNLKLGDKVKAGQVIAELGITPGGYSMLHCEMWDLAVKNVKNRLHSSFRSWKKGGKPPKYLLNPTKYLLAVRKQEFERRQQSSSASTSGSTIYESSIPDESESLAGSILSDVGRYATLGKEFVTVSSAYLAGNTDENSLTNTIFFDRHPERKNQPIRKHEKKEAREWIEIRDKIVRPIIVELKKKSQPAATSVDLPLVLAGPIVRRATKSSIWFWIALSEKTIGIYTTMFRYDTKGSNLGRIPLSRPTTIIRQLGKNFWVALFEVMPLEGSFPTDTVIGYDVEFQFYNKIPEHRKLSDEKLSINYMPFELPTLIIGDKNTKIAHGSCRRPGSGYADYPDTQKDAFGVFDGWMSDKATSLHERPASLILTGDQIYADDLVLPIFDAIQKLSYDIFGYYEEINFDGKLIPSNKILARPEGNEKNSRRRQLTHYSTSPIGFSTTDGEAHLLSFPEYASMYLLVWSPELWQRYCNNDPEIQKQISENYPTLGNPNYNVFVKACRKVMSNCASYMICDDHDFTDDYNLDKLWERTTKESTTGRQILSNASMAYFVFQAWGNDPSMFEGKFVSSIFNYLSNLMTNNGMPEKNVDVLYSTILNMHWSFMTGSNPKALCVDIRTAREFPEEGKPNALPAPDRTDIDYEGRMARIIGKLIYFNVRNLWTSGLKRPAEGKSAILVGSKARQNIERLLKKNGFTQNDVLLMVLPTPFIGHPFHILAQELVYPYPLARYPGDWEFFDNNTSQRASLVYWLKETFKPSALVIYSGDVHYGSVVYGGYACAKSLMDAIKGNFKWKLPVIQITSSPIKNGKEILWKIMKAGEVPQWYTPEARARYSTETEGHFIGAGFNTAELSGELGKFTVVHQNHFCVVTMPNAQEMKVNSMFIGVKDGKLAKAETSIHVHNNDFMKPLAKVLPKVIFGIR